MIEVSCTDKFPHQISPIRRFQAGENLHSDATEGTASQHSPKQPYVTSFEPSQGLSWLKGQTGKMPFDLGLLLFWTRLALFATPSVKQKQLAEGEL